MDLGGRPLWGIQRPVLSVGPSVPRGKRDGESALHPGAPGALHVRFRASGTGARPADGPLGDAGRFRHLFVVDDLPATEVEDAFRAGGQLLVVRH